jgi:hypothetical protein
MTQVWINTARCKHARAIGLGEGRGPTWPPWTHHVDGGVWNALVCACANHTCPTRGTRRELGSEVSRNEALVNPYRQTTHNSPHEGSRIRWVLLGTAAQLCRNNLHITKIHMEMICGVLSSTVNVFDAHCKDSSNGTCSIKFSPYMTKLLSCEHCGRKRLALGLCAHRWQVYIRDFVRLLSRHGGNDVCGFFFGEEGYGRINGRTRVLELAADSREAALGHGAR